LKTRFATFLTFLTLYHMHLLGLITDARSFRSAAGWTRERIATGSFCAAILVLAICLISPAKGDEKSDLRHPASIDKRVDQSAEKDARPQFVKVHLPVNRPEQWPRTIDRYLPLEIGPFLKRIDRTNQKNRLPQPEISEAIYQARLDNRGLLVGKATWQIKLAPSTDNKLQDPVESKIIGEPVAVQNSPLGESLVQTAKLLALPQLPDIATNQKKQSFEQKALSQLTLQPFCLAIESISWADGSKKPTLDQSFEMQQSNVPIIGQDQLGRTTLLVDREGDCQLNWSLAARKSVEERLDYRFAVPRSGRICLNLDLPSPWQPVFKTGMLFLKKTAIDSKIQRWEILLTEPDLALSLVRGNPEEIQLTNTLALRQTIHYDFTPKEIEVSSEIGWDENQTAPDRLQLVLDRPLQLIKAQFGEQSIPWTIKSEPGKSDSDSLTIELQLPESPVGKTSRVSLVALAPLVVGQHWKLPRVMLQQQAWRQAKATLFIPATLRLNPIEEQNCRQTKTASITAPRTGELIELQNFSHDATVEVIVTEPSEPIQIDYSNDVELSGIGLTSKWTGLFRSTDRQRFELRSEVAPTWIIDSVVSVPPGDVEDWRIEKGPMGTRLLSIRLARALAPHADPIRLSITARKLQSPLGQRLSAADLTPLRWRGAQIGRRLSVANPAEGYRLTTLGGNSQKINPSFHLAGSPELSIKSSKESVFLDDEADKSLRLILREQRPGYIGTTHVDATATETSLQESYRFLCRPETSPVDRIIVHFSQNVPEALSWTLNAEDPLPLTARKLTEEQRIALGLGLDGQIWEVSLVPARDTPFEIDANRTIAFDKPYSVCLASLPEAHNQTADLTIRAIEGSDVAIENRRLEPIPPLATSPGLPSTSRASFRYNPNRLPGASTPAVMITPKQGKPGELLLAWQCRLESCHATDGTTLYRATYYLENRGSKRLLLWLPELSNHRKSIRRILVDNKPVTWQIENASPVNDRPSSDENQSRDATLSIDLPSQRRFPTLLVEYTIAQAKLPLIANIRAHFPKVNFPVAAQNWTAWFPAEYELLDENLSRQSPVMAKSSWRERLFGGPGRETGQPRYNPFSRKTWNNLFRTQKQRELIESPLDEVLSRFTDAFVRNEKNAEQPIRWSELFRMIDDSTSSKLILDRTALTYRGAKPDAIVPFPTYSTTSPAAWLKSLGIELVADHQMVLLTDLRRRSIIHHQSEPQADSLSHRLLPGPLKTRLESVIAGHRDAVYIQPSEWADSNSGDEFPWKPITEKMVGTGDLNGWIAVSTEQSGTTSPITVVRRAILNSFRWIALLSTLAICTIGTSGRRWRLLPWISIIAAIGALTLPRLLCPIASGIFLGSLMAWGFHFLLGRTSDHAGDKSSSRLAKDSTFSKASFIQKPKSAHNLPLLLLVLCILALLGSSNLFGEPYRILIPIDDSGNPTTGKVYVPEPFIQELDKLDATSGNQPAPWIIEKAFYRTRLSEATSADDPLVNSIEANFTIRVVEPIGSIRFPLSQSQVRLVKPIASLDGKPFQPKWDPEGRLAPIAINGVGLYRLTLHLAPSELTDNLKKVRSGESPLFHDFSIPIPPVVRSRLEAELPDSLSEIEVPSALGATTVESGILKAQLGPATSITLKRPYLRRTNGIVEEAEIEEQLLLVINPASVTLKARLHFHRKTIGVNDSYLITIDPNLKLLPPTTGGQLTPIDGTTDKYQLELAPATRKGEKTVFQAEFLLEKTTGIGRVQLPRFYLDKMILPHRLLAVSIHPALKYEINSTLDSIEPINSDIFLQAWDDPDQPEPTMAVALPSSETAWSISTSPRPAKTTVNRSLLVNLNEDEARLQFDAKLTTTASPRFRYRLIVPESLQIDSATLHKEGLNRLVRTSHTEPGCLDLFLDGPVKGTMQLKLVGRMPVESEKPFLLEAISLEDSQLDRSYLSLFRSPKILVDIESPKGLEEIEPTVAQIKLKDRQSRPVAFFRTDTDSPSSLKLTIRPNRPKIETQIVTAILREKDNWLLKSGFKLTPTGGAIDQIMLRLPESIKGPLTFDPPMTLISRQIEGRNQTLTLRPLKTLKESFVFRMETRLKDDRVTVPDIKIIGAAEPRHHIVLQEQWHTLPLNWEIQNLKRLAAPLPKNISKLLGQPINSPRMGVYSAKEDSFRAACNLLEPFSGTPVIRLANIQVRCRSDRSYFGIASYDLDPSGKAWSPLFVPANCRLIRLSIEGVTVLPQLQSRSKKEKSPDADSTDSAGRYQFPLVSRNLPQRVVVLFESRLTTDRASGKTVFEIPRLSDATIEKTFWSLTVSPSMHVDSQQNDKWSFVTQANHAASCAEAFRRVLDTIEQNYQSNQNEIQTSRTLWASRLLSECDRLENSLNPIDDPRQLATWQDSLDRWRGEYGSEMGDRTQENKMTLDWCKGPLTDPNQSIIIADSEQSGRLQLTIRPIDPRSAIEKNGPRRLWLSPGRWFPISILPGHLASRADLVAGLVMIAIAIFMIGRFPAFGNYISVNPWLIGTILGILWWSLLDFGSLGLLLVILSLASIRISLLKNRQRQKIIIPLDD
jgi:hypothetical protein